MRAQAFHAPFNLDGQEKGYTCCKNRLSPAGRGGARRSQVYLCLLYLLSDSVRSRRLRVFRKSASDIGASFYLPGE